MTTPTHLSIISGLSNIIARYDAAGRYTGEVERALSAYRAMLEWIDAQYEIGLLDAAEWMKMSAENRDGFAKVIELLNKTVPELK